MLDKTAFCVLLTGLLKIDSALTLISFAGRDDANGFFFVMFILHAIDVDNQKQRARSHPYGVSPLFARHDAETLAALSKTRPPCFFWLIRFFSSSSSNRIAIQNV